MTGDELVEIAARAFEAAALDDKSRTAWKAAEALEAIYASTPDGWAKGLRWGTLDMARAMRQLVWPGLRLTRAEVYPAFAKELRAMQFCGTIGRRDEVEPAPSRR